MGDVMKRMLGVNTWVWVSPLTDENIVELLERIAGWGFDSVELPLEYAGAISDDVAVETLTATGLTPYIVGAMAPGRDLVRTDPESVRATQDYLRELVRFASVVGAPTVAGPLYSAVGRVWRMSEEERSDAYAELRENLAPVVEYAASMNVVIGIEPINRYETSLINTVEQALEALDPMLGAHLGVALDTYHMNIEQRSSVDAIHGAAGHIAHVQVCGNDRGAPGNDQTDWVPLLAALDQAGYTGPLNIESFTADNASIATAASIWRPLSPTQDQLATDGLAFLETMQVG
jgi:D-psicose/D-tagatose/L-ribulose 3-epimerase